MKSLMPDPSTELPVGLKNSINITLKCCICRTSPIKPPLIIAKCCKSILGCEECINELYRGEEGVNKPCPLCRAERAFTETMRLYGVEGLLHSIGEVIGQSTEQQNL